MNKGLKPGPGGWATILTAHPDGPRSNRALISGYFAVHRTPDYIDQWTVTHTRTGLAARHFPDFANARSFVTGLRRMCRHRPGLDTTDRRLVVSLINDDALRDLANKHRGFLRHAVVTDADYEQFEEIPS